MYLALLVQTHENMSQCDSDNCFFNPVSSSVLLVLGIPLKNATQQKETLFSFARIMPLDYKNYKQGFTGS